MLTQAIDFKEESDALHALLQHLPERDFARRTQFKGWTVNDVLEHLHMWNWAANESLVDEPSFERFIAQVMQGAQHGLKPFERQWIDGLSGRALLERWHSFYLAMAERFADTEPKKRLKWAGPDMSARSSITARLMETWAHGQEVYDLLGAERRETDRIRNIVVLGVNTFGWTYATRSQTPPADMPFLRLRAPSGEIWQYGEPSDSERIDGEAVDFCRVVTQVRNIADTGLQVTGAVAADWMSKAQCFAGAPETPPPPGSRFRQ